MLESKDYYIDLINSHKALLFTARWHYSHAGFKKAKINLGIYRKTDNRLVGVSQWGVSAQDKIRLDRYVKEPITTNDYLELNRFCMEDGEGRNSESQAIALSIKWIKQNRPDIKLLVSYAGRKEGNYGFIYQATNWEYLGYFISPGFWFIDGIEKHQLTLWFWYKRHGNPQLGFRQSLLENFQDVRQTWTKQFIYIQRLDKHLTPASEILPYPKESNEYPICTKVKIYKQNDAVFTNPVVSELTDVNIYYEKDTMLFSSATARRKGEYVSKNIAIYDSNGCLIEVVPSAVEASRKTNISNISIGKALKSQKLCRQFFFRYVLSNVEADEMIDIPYLAIINGIQFQRQREVAEYCDVSQQAVSLAYIKKADVINGYKIEWGALKE